MMTVLLTLLLLQEGTVAVPGAKVPLTLVKIPAGKLGEVPVAAFRMGKHEVTWGQYFEFQKRTWEEARKAEVDGITRPSPGIEFYPVMGLDASYFADDRPIVGMRLHSAVVYCDWLSKVTGRRFRLPTETEWEYACREEDEGWHRGNAEGPQVVASRKANALGLHDMLGNVWEYCLDSMEPPQHAPVLRGGAWNSKSEDVTPRARRGVTPDWYDADPNRPRSAWWLFTGHFAQGFRVACAEDGVAAKDRSAYLPNIEVKVLGSEVVKPQARPAFGSFMVRVWGEVLNKGDRTISELDITAYYLTSEGNPHLAVGRDSDQPGRPTFGRCHPVMVPLGKGDDSKPLKPGEKRAWSVDVPYCSEEEVQRDRFGARVEALLFAP